MVPAGIVLGKSAGRACESSASKIAAGEGKIPLLPAGNDNGGKSPRTGLCGMGICGENGWVYCATCTAWISQSARRIAQGNTATGPRLLLKVRERAARDILRGWRPPGRERIPYGFESCRDSFAEWVEHCADCLDLYDRVHQVLQGYREGASGDKFHALMATTRSEGSHWSTWMWKNEKMLRGRKKQHICYCWMFA